MLRARVLRFNALAFFAVQRGNIAVGMTFYVSNIERFMYHAQPLSMAF